MKISPELIVRLDWRSASGTSGPVASSVLIGHSVAPRKPLCGPGTSSSSAASVDLKGDQRAF